MRVFRNLDNLPTFKNAVVTIGSFDGLHLGHQQLLKKIQDEAKAIDGEDVVITFSPHPRMVVNPNDKSLLLLNELEEKLELLEKSGVSNCVIVPFTLEFSQQSPASYIEDFIIKNFSPKVLVIGYDHKFGYQRTGDFSLLQEYQNKGHFNLIKIEKEEIAQIAISSTKVRKALQEGHIAKANSYLGYSFFISGEVVYGQQIGKSLGFPTANIEVKSSHKIIPKVGIYSCYTTIEGERYPGMMYIGPRPSIEDSNHVSIEVHIFDFERDIYGQHVKVEFENHIREDVKFNNLDELSQQLKKDEITVREQLGLSQQTDTESSIAVVVLNYNGERVMKEYLSSLYQSCLSYRFDLVVIDNGSTDESVQYLKENHPKVKLVCLEKNLGFAGGYNKGIEQLDYEYIALVNSDVEGTDGWLDPIIKAMKEDTSIGVAQPKILSWTEKQKFEYAGAAGGYIDALGYPYCRGRIFDTIENDKGQYDDRYEVDWASGCAFVTRQELYTRLDGFDDNYFAHMEEIDLCLRAKQSGMKIMAMNDTAIFHLGGGTLDYESPNKTFLNFRNNLSTVLKNYSTASLLFVIPARLILDGVAGLKFVTEGRFKNMIAIVRAHFSLYARIGNLLGKRKEIKKSRKRPLSLHSPVKSILWNYYIRGIKHFNEFNKKRD